MIVVAPCPFEDDFTITPDVRAALARHDVRIVVAPAEAPDLLADAEVLVVGFENELHDPLEYARLMPRLRWVHTLTAGLGPVASGEIADRNVIVTNGAGVFAVGIAEYVFASLVMLARDLPAILSDGRSHRWAEQPLGWELAGKQLGIIGLGGIGARLAELATAAGMAVSAVTRSPERHRDAPVERLLGPAALAELLATSDAVVLCASLNPTTRELLGAPQFRAMRTGALLVNVSRGPLVDERALIEALTAGTLAGAMVDVTVEEPLPPDSPLWDAPNLLITPHLAGGTREGRARSLERFLSNLGRLAAGAPDEMASVVDLPRELSRSAGRPADATQ